MPTFITQFQSFITKNQLFVTSDRVLLAVSGGVDSVVLCYLLFLSKYNFGIAHCNFQLRGEASAADEAFVKNLAEKFRVPFFSIQFQTQEFAEARKISIQMAARELRYEWLDKIRQAHDYQWIATAHHLNDSIETFFYNFAKGTGIRGLHGIPIKNNQIIRPLSFATKQEIVHFAKELDITYREDASNNKDVYARNKIRHHIVPVFKALNPDFEHIAAQNLQHIRETEILYNIALEYLRKEIIEEEDNVIKINLHKIAEYQPVVNTLLYEWLKPFSFNNQQIAQMQTAEIGAIFYSPTHRLLVDRMHFIIEKTPFVTSNEQFVISEPTAQFITNVGILTFEYKTDQPNAFPNDPFTVYLDAEKLIFPLKLRHWQAGDVFYPLGLSGKSQKLQDFFTNRKLSRFDKERVWLLESGGAICWVVGHRLDERFKISSHTKSYWVIQFKS
ncbi:MAG: tRNA lysidine(34) synthetase TilS [Saprospiraceae bacterium]